MKIPISCPFCCNDDREYMQTQDLKKTISTENEAIKYVGPGREYYCLMCGSLFAWRKGAGFNFEDEQDDIDRAIYGVMNHLIAME